MENTSNRASGDMHAVIIQMSKNMRFLGMAYIIVGGFYCLSIIGALIGVPLLISGLRLRESADSFGDWLDHEEGALLRALERQGRFFAIQAILLIVSIVMMVVGLLFGLFGLFAMFSGSM